MITTQLNQALMFESKEKICSCYIPYIFLVQGTIL